MRIRSIRPEFWRSEDIEQLDWHTRLVFIGLWSYVDDNGVGRDRVSDIAADLFSADLSRDPRETLGRVSEALGALSEAGLIKRYTDGKRLLYVTGWDKHQRIDNPSRNPRYKRPTSGYGDTPDTLATVSRDASESAPTGEGEKGRRGEGEKSDVVATATPTLDDTFATFWQVYPRKDDRLKARKAWTAAVKRSTPGEITEGAVRYRDDPNRDPGYTKLGATWLNAESWENGPLPARGGRPTTESRVHGALALAERFRTAEQPALEGPR